MRKTGLTDWLRQFAAALLLMAGCSTSDDENYNVVTDLEPVTAETSQYAVHDGPGLQCVPYARERSGIGILGDAYTWWDTAEDYFARGHAPVEDAVLVLKRTNRLEYGHLAVVSKVLGPREILVDHANWIPGKIITGMPVLDISRDNDWTLLRFWNAEAKVFGKVYPARGFIYNPASIASVIPGAVLSNGPTQQVTR